MRTLTAFLFVLLIAASGSGLAQDPGAGGADDSVRDLLDAVREDLVDLRFEKALAAIAALLGDPAMSEAEKFEVLVLRVQTHVAFGDLDAAEEDYREILRMRPGYRPESSLTPDKAMKRYRKVRGEMVGQLRVTVEPADTAITVDGREVVPEPDGLLPLLSGEHVLRAERAGHDPFAETVSIEAGKESPLKIELVPNARTLVLRTEPAGVDIVLDGVLVGRTERPEPGHGAGQPSAQLVLENVPLGEHEIDLSKECYRTERLRDVVTIDLLDRTPKIYSTVSLSPASSTLQLEGGPAGAQVFIDDVASGQLPLGPSPVCPGLRQLEVRVAERVIWRTAVSFEESRTQRVPVTPRPSIVLVGAKAWPAGFEAFSAQFSHTGSLALPAGSDLATAGNWSALRLPADTDLALAIVPAERDGAADRYYLFSPLLNRVERLDGPPRQNARPRWSEARWGFDVVDSEIGGPALVVGVAPDGPVAELGLEAGSHLTTLDGREVAGAAEWREKLAAIGAGGTVVVEWRNPTGKKGAAEITAARTPRLRSGSEGFERDAVRVAWAVVDAMSRPEDAPAAQAGLALLLGEYGHHEMAAETWRSLRWESRAGIGEGTRQYYLGRELERLGREKEAVAAYRAAAASQATVFNDDGPRVAPAARDRLADLGVVVNAP